MAITASEARRHLSALIEQVNDDRTPVEIISPRGAAVLIAKPDFDALEETAHLLRSPAERGAPHGEPRPSAVRLPLTVWLASSGDPCGSTDPAGR